jgi:hypothetical protein
MQCNSFILNTLSSLIDKKGIIWLFCGFAPDLAPIETDIYSYFGGTIFGANSGSVFDANHQSLAICVVMSDLFPWRNIR